VHKGSTQTNKRSKLGFKSKREKEPKGALVWCTGLSGVPPDSVRCTRTVQLRTLHSRVSEDVLRYNSPDFPMHQLSNGSFTQRSTVSGAPVDSSPTPTVVWWLRAINTPQPPPLQPSKHSSHFIQYKSKVQHSKTQIKSTDPIKVPNSILVL
jgi:hypothetical protein